MTAVEKRKLLEFVGRCVRYDLLSDIDVYKILDICGAAVDRSIKKKQRRVRSTKMNYDAIRPDGPTIAIEHQATGDLYLHALDPEWQRVHKQMGFISPLADLYEALGFYDEKEQSMNINAIQPDGQTIVVEGQAFGEQPVNVTPEGTQPAAQAADPETELNLKAAMALLTSAKDLIEKETARIPGAKEEQTDRQRLLLDLKYSIWFAIVELDGILAELEAKA